MLGLSALLTSDGIHRLSIQADYYAPTSQAVALPHVRGFPTLSVLWLRGLHPRTAEDFEAVSSPRLPRSFTFLEWSPLFTLIESSEPLRRRLSKNSILLWPAPQWARGTSGASVPSVGQPSPCVLSRRASGVITFPPLTVPSGQGIETGGPFPVGQNPLRLNSPYDPSAKPRVLVACLAPHEYLSGACCSRFGASRHA